MADRSPLRNASQAASGDRDAARATQPTRPTMARLGHWMTSEPATNRQGAIARAQPERLDVTPRAGHVATIALRAELAVVQVVRAVARDAHQPVAAESACPGSAGVRWQLTHATRTCAPSSTYFVRRL